MADANSDSYEKNENDCSNDDGDDSIEGSTNEVNAPIATKRAITITSFFSVNKRLSPNPNIRISDKKNLSRQEAVLECQEIVENLKHKKARKRWCDTSSKQQLSIERSDENSLSEANESVLLTQSSGSGKAISSSSVVTNRHATDITLNKSKNGSSSSSSQSSSSLSKASTATIKAKIPYLDTQMARINKIRKFDQDNGTLHAECFSSTRIGVYCNVCDVHIKDMTQLFNVQKNSLLHPNCHIASVKHNRMLEISMKTSRKNRSLFKILSEVTPSVDDEVNQFRFDLVELFLKLRIPLSSVNDPLFIEFVSR